MFFRIRFAFSTIAAALLVITVVSMPIVGCESLPGDRDTQATVIGGAAGAAIGAAVASENRLIGALIGGALGAGGGYLIGSQTDWFEGDDDGDARSAARQSIDEAQNDPATPSEARRASTADINQDGFVTLDEVVAMQRAGLGDAEMIDRLEATGQVFDLTNEQREYLVAEGVSRSVIRDMLRINQTTRERILASPDDVISSE